MLTKRRHSQCLALLKTQRETLSGVLNSKQRSGLKPGEGYVLSSLWRRINAGFELLQAMRLKPWTSDEFRGHWPHHRKTVRDAVAGGACEHRWTDRVFHDYRESERPKLQSARADRGKRIRRSNRPRHCRRDDLVANAAYRDSPRNLTRR